MSFLEKSVASRPERGRPPSPDRWLEPHSEPPLWDLIDDPIGAAIRRRDALEVSDVMAVVREARACLMI